MNDLKKRIEELEKRIEKIEEGMGGSLGSDDRELMDAFYEKAKELVLKHKKSSVIFLQKQLMIDYERAVEIVRRLRAGGVISD